MKRLVAVAILVTTATHADIYKCNIDGIELFSQQPCAVGAEKITVDVTSKPTGKASTQRQKTASDGQKQVDLYLERQRLEREIAKAEGALKMAREKLDAAFKRARADKERSANNIAGAAWETSISKEMQAAVAEYELALQLNMSELGLLRSELDAVAEAEEKPTTGMEEIEQYNADQARKRRIQQIEQDVTRMQAELQQEIKQLDAKVNTARSNWAGSMWAESIRLEKQAITSRYTQEIALKQSELLRLKTQR